MSAPLGKHIFAVVIGVEDILLEPKQSIRQYHVGHRRMKIAIEDASETVTLRPSPSIHHLEGGNNTGITLIFLLTPSRMTAPPTFCPSRPKHMATKQLDILLRNPNASRTSGEILCFELDGYPLGEGNMLWVYSTYCAAFISISNCVSKCGRKCIETQIRNSS